MTKKDYELIAKNIAEQLQTAESDYDRHTITVTAYNLAIAMSKENAKFNMTKFLKACGA
jgi:hypothetical protein